MKHTYGRGGAGNVTKTPIKYVDGITYSPPLLTEKRNPRYSTGRGGVGNIRKFNAAEVIIAQDIPEGPPRTPHATAAGRGGFGNLQAMHKRERLSAELQRSPHSSEESQKSTTSPLSTSAPTMADIGVANYGKNILFRKKT
jgi:Protein of unknown function (DUF3602)